MLWHRILAGDVLWTNSPGTEARVKRWLEGLGQKLAHGKPVSLCSNHFILGRSSNSCLEFNWLKRWRSADDESRWSEFETRWVSFFPLGGRNRFHGSNWLSCRKPIKVIGWGCLKLSLDGGIPMEWAFSLFAAEAVSSCETSCSLNRDSNLWPSCSTF